MIWTKNELEIQSQITKKKKEKKNINQKIFEKKPINAQ